jgi:biopolymer transport protein TolR
MVTAPLITPGVVNLPTVGKSDAVPIRPIEIQIDKDGNVSWRKMTAGETFIPVERSALAQTILTELKENQAVVISAENDGVYKTVMQVLNDLSKNGVTKIGLHVNQEGDSVPISNSSQKKPLTNSTPKK